MFQSVLGSVFVLLFLGRTQLDSSSCLFLHAAGRTSQRGLIGVKVSGQTGLNVVDFAELRAGYECLIQATGPKVLAHDTL